MAAWSRICQNPGYTKSVVGRLAIAGLRLDQNKRAVMLDRSLIGAIALVASMLATIVGAAAFDETKYPDWKGQWTRIPIAPGPASFDPTKTVGLGQRAPLIPEYQAILEASVADQAAGGFGVDRTNSCFSPGMPRIMNVYTPMEIVITPDTVYIMINNIRDNRRIYTDGRDWSDDVLPSFAGYSIGRWIDTRGQGRYDELLIETRLFAGPRAYDDTGLPLHRDNQTIVKERIYGDAADPNVLHDDITVIDHALTRPWSATKNYRRGPQQARLVWRDNSCVEENQHVRIGKESYMLSADGLLMPVKRDQAPPDLRYFKPAK
jgi:hypothetical protein